MPGANEPIVVNTGPLIALGKVGALEIVKELPLRFLVPREVADEIYAGAKLGYPVAVPDWITIVSLAPPLRTLRFGALDSGESAVIQLALEQGIRDVCIDEWRGRRAALAAGLNVTGSLGLLGRAKRSGVISEVRPWIDRLSAVGVHFHPELLVRFLSALGERADSD